MSKKIKQALNNYYHDISKALVCHGQEKRKIIKMIKDGIDSYMCEHPDASIEAIIAHFGSAENVAEEYCNNEDADKIRTKIKRGKIILICIILFLVIALLVYIVAIITAVIADIKSSSGYDVIHVESMFRSEVEEYLKETII